MSMILSIYSQKAFREVVLTEHGLSQMQILIRRDLFQLRRDIVLKLEKEDECWVLESGEYDIALRNTGHKKIQKVTIRDGLSLDISTRMGDEFTLLAYEQRNPFGVYHKYALGFNQRIEIGRGEENAICYRSTGFVSQKHCTIDIRNGRAYLIDSSRNGTYLNFKRVNGSHELQYGDSIRIFRLNMIFLGQMLAINEREELTVRLQHLSPEEIEQLAGRKGEMDSGEVIFHRAPRNFRELNTEPIEIETPPNPPEKQDVPLAMTIGPALTMAIPMALSSVMAILASRAGGTNSGYFMYVGLVTAVSSAVIGAIWALANVRQAKKQRETAEERRFTMYSEYLVRMQNKIQAEYEQNTVILRRRYISPDECCGLNETSTLLWNRNSTHSDFMSFRLGLGNEPFSVPINIPKEKFTLINDSLADKPRLIQQNFSLMKAVPVLVDFRKERLVGIVGGANRKGAVQVVQNLIAQIVTADCYTDVKLAIVYDEKNDTDRDAWNFMLWFPHVWSEDRKIRYIATNQTEMGDVFYALTQTFRNRTEESQNQKNGIFKPYYILIVTDPRLIDGSIISKYVIEKKMDIGLSTIILAENYKDLPNECECIIENDNIYQGVYHTISGMDAGTRIAFDHTNPEKLRILSKRLGCIKVFESGEEGEIPNSVTFFDMYGAARPEDFCSGERWKKSDTISSMKALIGLKSGNTPCYLDLHEKYHGPHGLVAGTTGSGKSETLQTYILSLAVNYSPHDIGFFIIDYKGGGMANLFSRLPHMMGAISNLSGNQVRRAMVSIKSENRRRQRIFSEFGVNNINSYTSLYKSGDAAEPLPHLIIIIDEFAELKREEPEFMKELISVAQVGRSLGVHLILATQRPSGTVDENIWANSRFRLCLRVQNRDDSMGMLHRSDAAYLTQTGRCYLQVGNDEIFELFQSGWSGAPYDRELGGRSLLIAQMLSATGKVDLAGNHAKVKQKEALKKKWICELIDIVEKTESELSEDVMASTFDFMNHAEFISCFYRKIRSLHPDFEENHYNNTRISEFLSVYRELKNTCDNTALSEALIKRAAKEGKRLPEIKERTQLEAVVDYLKETAENAGYSEPRKLWLPVLPAVLFLDDIPVYKAASFDGSRWPETSKRFRLSAVIGMGDDPENQAQMPVTVDFASGGHHVICGLVATGKSTFLQTVVYSLCMTYSPELLNIYCLDFSSHMLAVFDGLKHIGGVMDENDAKTDKIAKFFTMIGKIINERKKIFTGTNFEDYVNHNGWTIPAILIVIDNYSSFHEKTGEAYESIMMQLAKEGVGYGIFLLVSAAGYGIRELPNSIAENFRTGICLEMKDAFSYGDILHIMRPEVLPETNVKGRGLISYGGKFIEFQTALAGHSEEGLERNDFIRSEIGIINSVYKGLPARKIPSIPKNPAREDFTGIDGYRADLSNPEKLPVGYDAEYAEVYSFNLLKNFIFLITGTSGSGKTIFMKNMLLTCKERGDKIYVFESGEDSFYEKMAAEGSAERITDGAGIYHMTEELYAAMKERAAVKKKFMDGNATEEERFGAVLSFRRIDVFIGDANAFIRQLYDKQSPAYKAFGVIEAFCTRGKDYNIFLFAEVSDEAQADLRGYTAYSSICSYRSGIRFGGRLNDDKAFSFDNIKYQDHDRRIQPGIGIIPSDDKQARREEVVVPMLRG